MYNRPITAKTGLTRNESLYGDTIEIKVQKIMSAKEPITDASPLVYTERKDGVMPAYDIRTDRFEIAIEAMDKVTKSIHAKRDEEAKKKIEEKKVDVIEPPTE